MSQPADQTTADVSVIIPVYNTAAYLEQCVDSLLNQHGVNLEIILVNDGSTDRSADICDAYARLHTQVQVIHQANMGMAGARSTGLGLASGKYISFVDSDDWAEPYMYRTLFEYAERLEAEMVICPAKIFNCEKLRIYPRCDEKRWSTFRQHHRSKSFNLNQCPEILVGVMEVWRRILRRDWLEQIDFRFEKSLRSGEDICVSVLWAAKAKRIALVDTPLYLYRIAHSNQITSQVGIYYENYFRSGRIGIDFLIQRSTPVRTLVFALQQSLNTTNWLTRSSHDVEYLSNCFALARQNALRFSADVHTAYFKAFCDGAELETLTCLLENDLDAFIALRTQSKPLKPDGQTPSVSGWKAISSRFKSIWPASQPQPKTNFPVVTPAQGSPTFLNQLPGDAPRIDKTLFPRSAHREWGRVWNSYYCHELAIVRPNETVVDLGAGDGIFSLMMAARQSTCKVLAVESDFEKCQQMARLFDQLDVKNIDVIHDQWTADARLSSNRVDGLVNELAKRIERSAIRLLRINERTDTLSLLQQIHQRFELDYVCGMLPRHFEDSNPLTVACDQAGVRYLWREFDSLKGIWNDVPGELDVVSS